LKALLARKEIRDELEKVKSSDDGKIGSYRDGIFCKKNGLLSRENNVY
jgi:hypothetical protein